MGGRACPPLSVAAEVAEPADTGVIDNPPNPPKEGRPVSFVDGLREATGESAAAGVAGVGGPTCPWSNICSRAANSVLQSLHRMRRRGVWAPGVGGPESDEILGV
jgi:hypothetical protein